MGAARLSLDLDRGDRAQERRVPAPHARGSLRPPPLRGTAEWSLPRKKHVGGIWANRVRMNIPSPQPCLENRGGSTGIFIPTGLYLGKVAGSRLNDARVHTPASGRSF